MFGLTILLLASVTILLICIAADDETEVIVEFSDDETVVIVEFSDDETEVILELIDDDNELVAAAIDDVTNAGVANPVPDEILMLPVRLTSPLAFKWKFEDDIAIFPFAPDINCLLLPKKKLFVLMSNNPEPEVVYLKEEDEFATNSKPTPEYDSAEPNID